MPASDRVTPGGRTAAIEHPCRQAVVAGDSRPAPAGWLQLATRRGQSVRPSRRWRRGKIKQTSTLCVPGLRQPGDRLRGRVASGPRLIDGGRGFGPSRRCRPRAVGAAGATASARCPSAWGARAVSRCRPHRVGVLFPPCVGPPGIVQETPSWRGYDYLGTLLASHGDVVMSINSNMTMTVNPRPADDLPARAQLLLRSLKLAEHSDAGALAVPDGSVTCSSGGWTCRVQVSSATRAARMRWVCSSRTRRRLRTPVFYRILVPAVGLCFRMAAPPKGGLVMRTTSGRVAPRRRLTESRR